MQVIKAMNEISPQCKQIRSVEILPLLGLSQHRLNFLPPQNRAEPSKHTNKPQTGQKTNICTISRKQNSGSKGRGEDEEKHFLKVLKIITLRKIAPSLRLVENRL